MDSLFTITMPGFIFFLLIVCVGYVATGDLSTKTQRGSLERLIRYILVGIIINLMFLLVISLVPGMRDIYIKYYTELGKSAKMIGGDVGFNVQLILFLLVYLAGILSVSYVLRPLIRKILPRRF